MRPLPGSQTLGTAAALARLTFLYQTHVANAPGAHLSYQLYPVPTGLSPSAQGAGCTEGQDTIPTLGPRKQSRTPQTVTMKLTFIKQLLCTSSREAHACQLRPTAQGALREPGNPWRRPQTQPQPCWEHVTGQQGLPGPRPVERRAGLAGHWRCRDTACLQLTVPSPNQVPPASHPALEAKPP